MEAFAATVAAVTAHGVAAAAMMTFAAAVAAVSAHRIAATAVPAFTTSITAVTAHGTAMAASAVMSCECWTYTRNTCQRDGHNCSLQNNFHCLLPNLSQRRPSLDQSECEFRRAGVNGR